jgi:type I site-specific restriction-modification system R (restriction) subunit
MGAYKNKMLEEMDDEDHTDEYGGFMDNDEDETDFEELMEGEWIERQIEEELQTRLELEADLNEQQKALYNSMKVEKKMAKERISLLKSILGGA